VLAGRRRLAIEVDGTRYHDAWDDETWRRDWIRSQRLVALGWDVMRFWVYEIRDDLDRAVDRVKTWAHDPAHGCSPRSPHSGLDAQDGCVRPR
jgi:very-short-patch-repair endonuclease